MFELSWFVFVLLVVCLLSGGYAIGRQAGWSKGFNDAKRIYKDFE